MPRFRRQQAPSNGRNTAQPRKFGHSVVAGTVTFWHVSMAAVGVAFLVWLASPIAYDGIAHLDIFPLAASAVSLLAFAPTFGLLERVALRKGTLRVAVVCMLAFSVCAMVAPAVIAGRWFVDDNSTQPSTLLAQAIASWLTAHFVEWLIASRPARHASSTTSTASTARTEKVPRSTD